MDVLTKSLNAIDELFESITPEEFKSDLDSVRQGVGISLEDFLDVTEPKVLNRNVVFSSKFELKNSLGKVRLHKVQSRKVASRKMIDSAQSGYGMMPSDDLRALAA